MLGRDGQPYVSATGVAVLALAMAAGCVKQLPPAPTPRAVTPEVDTSAPVADGHGRLVVDVVDGPTGIKRVTMKSEPVDRGDGRTSYRFYESFETLCNISPCVVDLPLGNVLLGFPIVGKPGRSEVELVHIGAEPEVYRRSLSVYTRKEKGALYTLAIIAASVGGVAAMAGVAMLPAGLAEDSDGLTTAGAITLGVGAVLTTLGVWGIRSRADSFRPGASNHFLLGP